MARGMPDSAHQFIWKKDAFALYLLVHPTCANGHSHKVYDVVQEEAKYVCSYIFHFFSA